MLNLNATGTAKRTRLLFRNTRQRTEFELLTMRPGSQASAECRSDRVRLQLTFAGAELKPSSCGLPRFASAVIAREILRAVSPQSGVKT